MVLSACFYIEQRKLNRNSGNYIVNILFQYMEIPTKNVFREGIDCVA